MREKDWDVAPRWDDVGAKPATSAIERELLSQRAIDSGGQVQVKRYQGPLYTRSWCANDEKRGEVARCRMVQEALGSTGLGMHARDRAAGKRIILLHTASRFGGTF
jgi:hypothetical protein